MKNISLLFAMLLVSISMTAEQKTESLSQWAAEELAKYPEKVEGMTVFYPELDENQQLVVSDIIDVPGQSEVQIFTNALVYLYDNLDPETESIESIDYDSHKFIIARKMKQGSGKTTTAYEYILAFQMTDGLISFACYNIDAEYREKGILPRKLALEKLKPQEIERHKELVIEFSSLNTKYLNDIAKYATETKPEVVSHWENIENKEAVKGMNKTEIKLIFGRPVSERITGKRTKWMYADNSVVIFTNDIVTTIIE